MSKEHITCTNCETDYQKGFSFCPHCGQKADDQLTLGVLFYNTISNYFSFDARFIKGFIPLMFRPGFLPQKFVEGKRLLYLHPGQMYLFVAFIFFFVFSFYVKTQATDLDTRLKNSTRSSMVGDSTSKALNAAKIDTAAVGKVTNVLKSNQELLGLKDNDLAQLDSLAKQELKKNNSGTVMSFDFNEAKVDSLLAKGASDEDIYKAMGMQEDAGYITKKFFAQMLKFYKDKGVGSIIQTFYDSLPIALFFLLPLFALILKILNYKKGRYAHHLVFSLYFFSFLFTAFMLMYLLNWLFEIPDWIDWLLAFSTFFYLYFAVMRFYKSGWFVSLIKSGLATFIFLIVVAPVAAGLVLAFSFMFY